MLESKTLPISLTGFEVVFICDSILNKDVAEGLEQENVYIPLARSTLLILGSAYRELVSVDKGIQPGPVELHITEEMAWLLRSKVKTGDMAIDGQTNVGVTLLIKLYDILNRFNSDVIGLPPTSSVESRPMTDEDKQVLGLIQEVNKFKGEYNAPRREPHPGPDTNEGSFC